MNHLGKSWRIREPEPLQCRMRRQAFSLIELLVVMALLSFIVIGLLAVFNQTQRAFKAGMAQVDVLESGRATMDLITREVEEATAMGGVGTNIVNFHVVTPSFYPELLQALPGVSDENRLRRTNILQEFFFVSRANQEWIGTGYVVNGGADGIGSLYRYRTNIHTRDLSAVLDAAKVRDLYELYSVAALDDFRRVADGIIHFKVATYATNGYRVDPEFVYEFGTNKFLHRVDAWYDGSPFAVGSQFLDRALPTAVEIELAVVEPDVWEQVEALPSVQPKETIRRGHLEKQAGKVHVFRQRVPIRNFDPDAYNP